MFTMNLVRGSSHKRHESITVRGRAVEGGGWGGGRILPPGGCIPLHPPVPEAAPSRCVVPAIRGGGGEGGRERAL